MAAFGLTTLGQFAFTCGDRALPSPPTKKARALLAYLVMNRAANVSREHLLERFWPEFDPDRARDNLKVTLWSVRRSLRSGQVDPDRVIASDRSVVRWIAPIDFDVDRFTELATNNGNHDAAGVALSLYRGDFLEGDFDEWTVGERERLAALYETLLARAASLSKNVAAAEQLIGRNPYDESAYVTLIEAELQAGRPRAAALLVERCRSALREVGTNPTEDFERRFGMLRSPEIEARTELRLPFVAREPELSALSQRFGDAYDGRGSVTIVHGDAGIGKSSLLAQAAKMGTQRDLHVVELRCKERETQTLGEWEKLFEDLTQRRLADLIATAGFETTRTAARTIADALRAPSVVVVDDAQYLSGESFALLGELVAAASATQCFVIGVRPEGVARLRTLLHDRTLAAELRLDTLSDRDVESALRQAAGAEFSDLARVIFERTKGHPLYVVEILASLVESGALRREERGWRLHATLEESLPLPATLRAFIEGRLTARGSVPAMVASGLSLEPAASASELRVVLNMDEAQLLDALDDLLSLGLLVQPESRAQFAFSHDVVEEVAGAMLNAGRRVRLHAAFAQALEESRDRDASIRRARHLRAASQPMAAGGAYLKAARQSQEERAARDATERAREGIAVVERLERSPESDALLAELNRELALATLTTRDLDASLEAANGAVALARSARDDGQLGESLLARAAIEGWLGASADQLGDANEAATAAERAGAPRLRARALVEAAIAARTSAQRERALELAREAYEEAKRVEDWGVAQRASAEIVLTCATWWDFQEAQRWVPLGKEAALRGSSLSQAAHYDACAALWYLLERADDAEHDLKLAARLIAASQNASAVEPSGYPLPLLAFFNRYMFATLAIARERWDEGLAGVADLHVQHASATLPVQTDALAMLQVQALLWRATADDVENAREICRELRPRRAFQSVLGFSSCIELSRACLAARVGDADASSLLRGALDAVEEHARRTPLEADIAFARLAVAANEVQSDAVATRAAERAAHYRALRRAAAGAAWGASN